MTPDDTHDDVIDPFRREPFSCLVRMPTICGPDQDVIRLPELVVRQAVMAGIAWATATQAARRVTLVRLPGRDVRTVGEPDALGKGDKNGGYRVPSGRWSAWRRMMISFRGASLPASFFTELR